MRPLLLIVVALALATSAQSQTPARPVFDVASVKPHIDDRSGPRAFRVSYGPQGIDFICNLAFAMTEAYGISGGRIVGPRSLTKEALWRPLTESYEIVAKSDHPASKAQLRLMLQSLLEDRFDLKFHREIKAEPVYKLVVGKNGPKLDEAKRGEFVMSRTPDGMMYRNAEVIRLVNHLSSYLDRYVVDETNLTGLYDFVVKMPEDLRQDPPRKSDLGTIDSPSIGVFNDTLKQLGLQLVGGRAPSEYMVVDHVEAPKPN